MKVFLTRLLLPISIFRWLSIRFSQLYLDPGKINTKKKFLASLIACLLVFFLIQSIGGKFSALDKATEGSRNWYLDLIMNICKDQPLAGKQGADISILSVDDAVYRAWQEPYITPRAKIMKMIEFAVKHKAAVIVVDFDLSRPEAWQTETEADARLKQYLENIDNAPAGTTPAIILLRDVGREGKVNKLYDSILLNDSSLADHSGNVFWATATLPIDDDGLIRNYNWVEHYNDGAEDKLMLSAQLLSSYISYQLKHHSNNAQLAIRQSHQWVASAITGHVDLSFLNRWRAIENGLDLSPTSIMIHENDAANIRAHSYLSLMSKADRLSPAFYQDQIVFIGAMHSRTMDRHESVIGDKYGVELLAHATATMNHFGALQPLTGIGLWVYNSVLVLSMALILLLPSIFLIFVATGVVGTLIYLPASILLYQSGLTLDAAPPIRLIELAEPAIPFVLSLILNFSYLYEDRLKIFDRIVDKIRREWSGLNGGDA